MRMRIKTALYSLITEVMNTATLQKGRENFKFISPRNAIGFKREILLLVKEKIEIDDSLSNASQSNQSSLILQKVISEAEALRFKEGLGDVRQNIERLVIACSDLSVLLGKLKEFGNLKDVSLEDTRAELESIERRLQVFKDYQARHATLTLRIQMGEGMLESQYPRRTLFIENAISCLADERILKVMGFSRRLSEAKRIHHGNESFAKMAESAISGTIPDTALTIGGYLNLTKAKLQETRKLKAELEEQRSKVLSELSELQALIAAIKAHGREFVSKSDHVDKCPLCETLMNGEELSTRLSSSTPNNKEVSSVLSTDGDALKLMEEELRSCESGLSTAETILSLLKASGNGTGEDLTFRGAVDTLRKSITRVEESAKELRSLEELSVYYNANGIKESDIESIYENFTSHFPETPLTIENKEAVESLVKKNEESKQTTIQALSDCREELASINANMVTLTGKTRLGLRWRSSEPPSGQKRFGHQIQLTSENSRTYFV
jgi:hypothetical protein